MNGECYKNRKHPNDHYIDIASKMIARSIEETKVKLQFDMIEKSGLWDEFRKFCINRAEETIFDTIIKFCKKYPEKFQLLDFKDQYHYSNMVVIDKSFDAPTNDPGDAENFKKTEYDGESLHNLVNQRNY